MEPAKKADSKDKSKDVNVDSKVLDRYVGDYAFDVGIKLTVRREGDRLVCQTPYSSRKLVTVSETEFLDNDGAWRFTFAKAVGTERWQLTLENDDDVLHGERTVEVKLTGDDLKELVGDFYSEELDAVYHVSLKEGKLILRHRKGEVWLQPSAADKFTCPLGGMSTLEVRRNANKGVTGFTIGTPSCRAVRFVKVDLGK